MNFIAVAATLFSILVPSRTWYPPSAPVMVAVHADAPMTLMLTDFTGSTIDSAGSSEVAAGATANIGQLFPATAQPGTYLLYAVPHGKLVSDFVGTPLVIEVRRDSRTGAPLAPMVTRVQPLRYAVLHAEAGDMTVAFYYDVAPHSIENFLTLAADGYYDGLTFHRIAKDFVIQGGDPRGDGTGGPGYTIPAEFNARRHEEGVLSMARSADPNERIGLAPRPEFADSAGSQFFICLGKARQLDGCYTAFGRVVDGIETVRALGALPTREGTEVPVNSPVIKSIEVKAVDAAHNPYKDILGVDTTPATLPSTQPVAR